jgi:Bacteriophage head to tail connecting protein
MAKKPLEICKEYGRDGEAQHISNIWVDYNSQRNPIIERWKEVRNYVFATDTTSTTNKTLPWKNSTTLPKLCQIRDNLHSNYLSALFPNDDWLKWESYSKNGATKQKVQAIEAYMKNKTRQGGFRSTVSSLVYDYIDYGNAISTVDFEASFRLSDLGEKIKDYIGPKARRISPYDIVVNPIATSWRDSYKVIRSLKTMGEMHTLAESQPDNLFFKNALAQRSRLLAYANAYGIEEHAKAEGLMVDGFGNYSEYLQSGYCEVLEFYGDMYNSETGQSYTGRHIVIIDRMWVILNEAIPSWLGHAPIYHTGWRKRPDNLWAMGPLENLVGMQYRIDHLENLKADAMDLAVMPPLVIKGDVEAFEYKPGAEIHIDENGAVEELAHNVQWVLQTNNEIAQLEQKMEQYVGAPREAMGIRTAGEKTAFEVQQLNNAAGRIFQEKATTFETELLEPVLNGMLEVSKRNLDKEDVVRAMDNDVGVSVFLTITKDDITASGVIRPIGARHFAAQAMLVQNLTQVANTPIWNQISPHLQSKNLASLVEDVLGLNRYGLFSPNAAVFDQQETQRLAGQATEDLAAEQAIPPQQ